MGIFFRDDDDDDEEEYTGPTGDPFHDAIYGWDMGSGSSSDDDYNKPSYTGPIIDVSKRNSYAKKAWDYYMDFKEEEALHYIDMALDLDKNHPNNWNIKAIILEGMKRYPESEECYDKSLKLSFKNLVCDNKVRMLGAWADELLRESKEVPNGLNKLEKAKEINMKAIAARPGEKSEEDISKYLRQRESINFYINYEREYLKNLETLKKYSKDELFTITGKQFYERVALYPGMPLKLVKEPDNEHDPNAIAVYADDKKIGYVANNDYTKSELTSSASELQDKFQNTVQGNYLLYLDRYAEIQFTIGRIVK